MSWWHVHWARPAGAHRCGALEACRCGRVRLVVVLSGVPVGWTGWHPDAAGAETEVREMFGDVAPAVGQ